LPPSGWAAEFDPEEAGGEGMDEHGEAEGGGLPTQLLHNTTLSSTTAATRAKLMPSPSSKVY
jgi:hypothetical protein